MQKVVLIVHVHDDTKCRQRVMKIACSIQGVNQVSFDMEGKKLTLVGSMDPVEVVTKLRKLYHTTVDTIDPAKEPQKPRKDEQKPQLQPTIAWEPPYYPLYPGHYYYY